MPFSNHLSLLFTRLLARTIRIDGSCLVGAYLQASFPVLKQRQVSRLCRALPGHMILHTLFNKTQTYPTDVRDRKTLSDVKLTNLKWTTETCQPSSSSMSASLTVLKACEA